MKNNLIKTIYVSLICGLLPLVCHAQISNTVYFDKYNPRQHWLNPAFHPDGTVYVGMPGISTVALSLGNSRYSFQDLFQNIQKNGVNRSVFILDKEAVGADEVIDRLKKRERLFASYRINLLDLGIGLKNKGYITFGVGNRMDAMVIVPREFPDLFLKGMSDHEVRDFHFDKLYMGASIYSEVALGYSQPINDKITVGGKFKILVGHDNISTDFRDVEMVGSENEWSLKGDASIHASIPGLRFIPDEKGRVDDVEFDDEQSPSCYARSKGGGVALDLGMTYQILPKLQLSASLLDLGFIHWRKDLAQLDKSGDFVYNGIDYDINNDSLDYFDQYETQIENMVKVNDSPSAYNTSLCAKIHVGAEYSFLNDKIGLGALSKTNIYHRTVWEEFMLSANVRPFRWASLSVTYNMFDGQWNNLGAGLNFNMGPVNLNVAVDNIPFKYGKTNGVLHPIDKRNVRAMLGMGFVFGFKESKRKRDTDGDGVPDRIDQCSDTPEGVKVDAKGCPLDADRDGVPDYLDKCPKTVRGIAVDSLGCPKDSDGDGIADYRDKCPDTPKDAPIDDKGCPLDTDGDGVPDYMDNCSETPKNVAVDSLGCPKDSDGDGVADYMDKCPQLAGDSTGNGCPEIKEKDKQVLKKSFTGIVFQVSKSVIKPSSYPTLNEIAKVMKENPMYKLNIIGHTDSSGNSEMNRKLSVNRANAVKAYLVKKGIAADRLNAVGMGDKEPLVPNTTPENRAKNRRVELVAEY